MTDAQRDLALKMIAEGKGVRETARAVGVSAPTISRLRRSTIGDLIPPNLSPGALPTDPRARLEAIRDGWLTVAEGGLTKLKAAARTGQAKPPLSIQTGIASQRAAELVRLLDDPSHGLPEDLPDDDEQARQVVRRLAYRVAKKSGQAAVWKLAQSLGLVSAQQQPVEIAFERPVVDDAASDAAAAAGVPAASTRLQ